LSTLTTLARSWPAIEGAAFAAASAWSILPAESAPATMQPFCAPFVRRMRVRRRVSMSAMPTTFAAARYDDRSPRLRQFECTAGRSRITRPAANTRRDSTSSSLTPVLPMCG